MISREQFNKKQIVYCFSSSGDKIQIQNENVAIVNKGETRLKTSCYRLFAIYIIGECSITMRVIKLAHKFGFAIVFMTSSFKLIDIIGLKMEGNTVLRQKQYGYNGYEIGKFFVENKIANQITTVKFIREQSEHRSRTIKELKKYNHLLKESTESIPSIMGIEGICAKLYFNEIFYDIGWDGRKPRIKRDYINSALDIGYTILFNHIETILRIYGFDIYKGFLHKQFYMRKSLVCDFMEPFRCIIDRQLRKSIHLRQIKKEDFKKIDSRYVLKWECNKKYVRIYTNCINEYKEEIFLFIQSFYRSFTKGKPVVAYDMFNL